MVIMWTRGDFENPNRLVPAYLTASFLYYLHPEEEPIMSDELYDWVCKEIDDRWDEITHRHRDVIVRDDLRAGTAFSLRVHDYPSMARMLALSMSRGLLKSPKETQGQLAMFD